MFNVRLKYLMLRFGVSPTILVRKGLVEPRSELWRELANGASDE